MNNEKSIGQRLAEIELEREKQSKESSIYFKEKDSYENTDITVRLDSMMMRR